MSKSKVLNVWEAHGLRCAVLGMDMGHRCGYVEVPESHPWHGLAYSDPVPAPKSLDMEQTVEDFQEGHGVVAVLLAGSDGWADRLEAQVEVHGGLTFSGRGLAGVDEEGWWIGFDCAHLGDNKDPELMTGVYRDIARDLDDPGGRIWDQRSVEAETERLAEQVEEAA